VISFLEKINLGTLYFDGVPVAVGSKYETQRLSFGDTASANPVTWIKGSNGLLVADHTVCTNISWEQLDKIGFIFGRPIKIDGANYLCRSLKVGAKKGVLNEWDDLLDELGEEDSIWHWKNSFFWGQEIATAGAAFRAYRGYYSARLWNYLSASYRSPRLGFRPALEPLSPEPLISDNLVGTKLQVWGPTGSVSGILGDFTDYDLVFTGVSPDSQIASWRVFQADGSLLVDRSAISYISLV